MLKIIVLDRILFVTLFVALFLGNVLNIYLKLSFRSVDPILLLIFIRSLFLPHSRIRYVDLGALLFVLVNGILLLLNLKYLVVPSALLYLIRFSIYSLTYPFFIYFFKHRGLKMSTKWPVLIFLVFYLIIFIFSPVLNVVGYDPHVGRLYGSFLDPNFYSVLLIILLAGYLCSKKLDSVGFIIILLLLVSIFLTFSRVGLLLTILLLLFQYVVTKSSKYLSLFLGFFTLVMVNVKYLLRIFLVGGNMQSLVYRIRSYLDGISIYSLNSIPVGFNNILSSKYFLTSNLNMSSSYTDSITLNLLITGGYFNLLFVMLVFYSIGKYFIKSRFTFGLYFLMSLLVSSLSINTIFHPYFLILLVIISSYAFSLTPQRKLLSDRKSCPVV